LPLSRARIKERGYNQTHELLRIIAKNTNAIIDTQNVRRIKATKPLSSLNLEQRKKEIKGAFSAQAMPYGTVENKNPQNSLIKHHIYSNIL
jgi:predicted amidophosphoribosyltransferase